MRAVPHRHRNGTTGILQSRVCPSRVRQGRAPRGDRRRAQTVRVQAECVGKIKPLSAEQARALLDASAGDRYEALYTLALTTGARIGESLALRWADLDAAAGVLRIERTRSAAKSGPRSMTPKGGNAAAPT